MLELKKYFNSDIINFNKSVANNSIRGKAVENKMETFFKIYCTIVPPKLMQ